ncbi:MAG: hypothetical protein KDB82_17060 [Planctomycetes bacterium]|nr:hypothetical protein [Planctomycetota bacterium]
MRWGSGIVVGLFVFAYVATLLAENTCNLLNDPPKDIDRKSTQLLSAVGTTQRWNMFAPNVGTLSYSPIVVIVFKDGSRLALHSIVEPELPGWDHKYPIPNDVEGDVRNYAWRFHVGDGRIRKYETRAASSKPGWWKVRTNYTRWRVQKWLDAHPDRKDQIARVELWRAKIRHPGNGRVLNCESVEVLPISPGMDPDWPVKIDPFFPLYRG